MGQFHEVRFSTLISFGSSSGPGYKNNIIEAGNAVDERVPRQTNPRWRFEMRWGVKRVADLAYVQNFYVARRGVLIGFRLKDWLDYHSFPSNPSHTGVPGTRDQLLGTGTGSQTTFQLLKRYTDGVGSAIVRTVRKPVNATVLIWVNSVLKTEGVDFTIDYTTGILTFAVAPANGLAVEASFEFDVAGRFGAEIDQQLAASIDGFDNGNIPSIPIVEDLDPDVGYVGDMFYGGSKTGVVSDLDVTVTPGLGRVWPIKMNSTGKFARLVATTNLPAGQRIVTIYNDGSNAFGIKDPGGTTLIASLTAGQTVDAHIIVDGASQKVWLLS